MIVKLLRVIRLPFREYLNVLMPSLVGFGRNARGGAVAAKHWLLGSDARVSLAILVVIGGAVYAAILMTFYRERVIRYVRFLRGLRKGGPELVPTSS